MALCKSTTDHLSGMICDLKECLHVEEVAASREVNEEWGWGAINTKLEFMLGLGVREREIKSTIENFWEATSFVLKYVLYNEPVEGIHRERKVSQHQEFYRLFHTIQVFLCCVGSIEHYLKCSVSKM